MHIVVRLYYLDVSRETVPIVAVRAIRTRRVGVVGAVIIVGLLGGRGNVSLCGLLTFLEEQRQ